MAFVSYDSYKNRIEKLAKFKNFVVKYKFLIIGVLAVILGGISALLATKGMITTDTYLSSDTYVYGNSYKPATASAFLSDVGYEYTVQGKDEWTDVPPVKVGEYSVRAVSNKVIGKGYGKTFDFKILPAEITFTFTNSETATLIYGSAPTSSDYSYTGLVTDYGDRIVAGGVEFDYDYPEENAENNVVGVTLKKLGIVDKDGNDSSSCYVYEKKTTSYRFGAKPISFKIANEEETYNGKGFKFKGKADANTQKALVGSDDFRISTKLNDGIAPVDAGDYSIVLDGDIKVFDENGKDITYRYDISVGTHSNGTFTVNKRPVTLLSESEEWTYDGKAHSNKEYKITSGSVADGQKLTASSLVSVTDVRDGRRANELTYVITDSSNEPVTDNYILTKDWGTVKINARALTISTEGDEWEYDGTAHPVKRHTTSELAGGQVLVVDYYASESMTDVRHSGKNSVEYHIAWMNGDGTVYGDNYAVTTNYGDIKITPREITVKTGSATFVYDGTPQSFNYSFDLNTLIVGGSLALSTHLLAIDGAPSTVTDVADTKTGNEVTKFKVVGSESGNYNILYENGTLTVTKRDVGVTTKGGNWEYKGSAWFNKQIDATSGSLAPNQNFNVTQWTEVTDVTDGTANELTYIITDSSGNDVTANYNLAQPVWGTLIVTQRHISVRLNPVTLHYGDPIVYGNGNETVYKGIDGHEVVVDPDEVNFVCYELPDVGSYTISYDKDKIKIFANDKDVTKNYCVDNVYDGTFTVIQREITVKLSDMSVVYDGKAPVYEVKEGNYANEPDLVKGETLTILKVYPRYTSPIVGNYSIYTYQSEENVQILKADGKTPGTDNYIINFKEGKLDITARKITVQLNSYTVTYGDEDYGYQGGNEEVTSELKVVDGESLNIHNAYPDCPATSGVGDYDVLCTQTLNQILKPDGNGGTVDSTGNYTITFVKGTLTVEARNITITLEDATSVYGKPLGVPEKTVTGLVYGDEFNASYLYLKDGKTPKYYDVDDYGIELDEANSSFTYTNGDPSTKKNYVVESVTTDATLTVTPRPITVKAKDMLGNSGVTYGETAQYEVKVGNYANEPDLASGEMLKITEVEFGFTGSYPAVGKYDITPTACQVYKADGTTDSTGNYSFTYEKGELEITKRVIDVTLNNIADTTYGETVTYIKGGEAVTNAIGVCTVDFDTANLEFTPVSESATYRYPDAGLYNVGYDANNITVLSGGNDVTDNYTVNVGYGLLKITKRSITVKASSYEKAYGENFNYSASGKPNYEKITKGSLAVFEGVEETLVISVNSLEFDGYVKRDVGTYPVHPDGYKITKTDGTTDSSKNYEVEFEDGTLTITQKEIEVELPYFQLAYGSDEYHGKSYAELYAEKIVVETLPFGEQLQFTVGFTAGGKTASPKKLGFYDVVITKEEVIYSDGSITENGNYSITYTGSKKLHISTRQIEIIPDFVSVTYGDEIVYPSGSSNFTYGTVGNNPPPYNQPKYNEEIEITVKYALDGKNPPSVGKYDVIVDTVIIHYEDGTSETLSCSYSEHLLVLGEVGGYSIIYTKSNFAEKLEITERKIKVTLNDMPDAVYGNEIVYKNGGETADDLVSGHKLEVDPDGIDFTAKNGASYPNVGEYDISSNENFIKIYFEDENGVKTYVTSNYKVTEVINSTLTINARKITLTLQDLKDIVYGTETPVPTILGTVNGDTVTGGLIYKNTKTEEEYNSADLVNNRHLPAGDYLVYIDLDNYEIVYTNGAPSATQNYVIEEDGVIPAKLTISKRKITVTLKDFEREYGDLNCSWIFWTKGTSADHQNIAGELEEFMSITGELAPGEEIKAFDLVGYGSSAHALFKNAGTYKLSVGSIGISNAWADTIYDNDLGDVGNYEVTVVEPATLTINPKPLTVEVGDMTVPYGNARTALANWQVVEILPFDETLRVSSFALKDVDLQETTADVGDYPLDPDVFTANVANGSADNYEITISGTLIIEQREITVNLYDNEVYYGNDYDYLILRNGAYIGVDGGLVTVGEQTETLEITLVDYGFGDNSFPNASDTAYTVQNVEYTITKVDGTMDSTGNYSVKFTDGTLTINARPITITLENATSVYGEPLGVPVITVTGRVNHDWFNPAYLYLKDGKTPERYDVGDYDISLDEDRCSFTYTNGAPSTTKNYVIETQPTATLTVTPRPITITLNDLTYEYGRINSTAAVFNNEDIEKDLLQITGEYGLAFEETFKFAEIMSVETPDGYPLIKNAGSYTVELIALEALRGNNGVDYIITPDGGNYGTNYEISEDSVLTSTLTITPKEVELDLGDIEVIYGDKDYALYGYTYTTEKDYLPYGETIELTSVQVVGGNDYRLNVGAYDLDPDYNQSLYTVYDENGDEVDISELEELNYIVTVKGQLIVKKRPIEIRLIKFEKEDGEPYYYGDGEKLVYPANKGNYASLVYNANESDLEDKEGLAYGEQLQIVISWFLMDEDKLVAVDAPQNAGIYDYLIDRENSVIYDENGNGIDTIANNYQIHLYCGKVEIKPLDIEITPESDTKVYDGEAYVYDETSYSVDKTLPYGESLEISVIFKDEDGNVVTKPTDAGTYYIYLDTITVVNAGTNENAVIANYLPTNDDTVYGTLEISKRDITVGVVENQKFVYGVEEINPQALFYVTGFPEDEEILQKIVWFPSMWCYSVDGIEWTEEDPVDVGVYQVKATLAFVSYDSGRTTNRIDKNHEVAYAVGTFEIIAREVRLVTNTRTDFIYNGDYQYDNGYTLYYKNAEEEWTKFTLPDGETVILGDYTKVKNVCTGVDNEVELTFPNYNVVEREWGKLTVSPLEITIESATASFVYDGKAHSDDGYKVISENQLIDRHEIEVTNPAKVTNVAEGEVENTLTYKIIDTNVGENDEDRNVTKNYKITEANGTLTVTPRPIVVVRDSASKEYDGEALTCTDYVKTYCVDEDGNKLFDEDGNELKGLLGGDEVYAVEGKITELYRATTVDNETEFEAYSDNYEVIRCEGGSLTVTPKTISIVLNNYPDLIYGEETYPDEFGNFTLSDGSLAEGDELKVAVKYVLKGGLEEDAVSSVRNAGTYTVYLDKANSFVQTSYDGKNGLENYVIDDCQTGEITISPKGITVALEDVNKVYGESYGYYPDDKYEVYEGGLVSPDTLQVFVRYFDGENEITINEETVVGDYAVEIDYCAVNGVCYYRGDEDGVIDCGNYVITFAGSTLTVDPRPIVVVTGSKEKEGYYDGTAISCPDYERVYYKGTDDGIMPWDDAEDVLSYVRGSANLIINAGTVDNEAEFIVKPDNANYELAGIDKGTLTIKQRPIVIELSDIDDQVYGKPLTYPDGSEEANFTYAETSECEVVVGETLTVAVKFKDINGNEADPVNVGTYFYGLDLENSTVSNSIGGAGIENYSITCFGENDGKKSAKIDRLAVTVELEEWAGITYDGETHSYGGGYSIVAGGIEGEFAYDEVLTVKVDYYSVKAGVPTAMSSSTPRNAGEYRAVFNADQSTIGGNKPDLNYVLTVNYPSAEGEEVDYISFTIGRKEITITMGAETRPYNGKVYNYLEENDNFNVTDNVRGENIVPKVIYENGAVPKDYGTYTIVLVSFTVSGSNNVKENYYLKNEDVSCTLEITQRQITVKVQDRSIERPATVIDPLNDEKFDTESNGDFGFVEEDLAKLTLKYSYKYLGKDGKSTPVPVTLEEVNEIGIYEVSLSFEDNDGVLGNYDITKNESGTLEITARKVCVKPVYNGKVWQVYDGEPIDLADFTYLDWHYDNIGEGFAADFDHEPKYYFIPEGSNTGSYDAPVNAGKYTVRVDFPTVSDEDYRIDNSETIPFEISKRTVKVNLEYDASQYANLTYSYDLLPTASVSISDTDETGEEKGILDCDSGLEVKWYFYNTTWDKEVEYNYAGYYAIMFKFSEENDNYELANPVSDVTFTVNKAVIYITPKTKPAVDYTHEGQTLSLDPDDYEIRSGNLYGDDELAIEGSGVLKTTRSLSVTIKKARALQNGKDVTDYTYDIHYAYKADDPLAGKEDWYTRSEFTTMLSFNPVQIKYRLIIDSDHRNFNYDGTAHDLGIAENEIADHVEFLDEDGNVISVAQAFNVGSYELQYILIPILPVRVYEKWVRILVFDGNGNNVTSLFEFNLSDDSDIIEVKGYDLNFAFTISDGDLEEAWANKDSGSGAITSSSLYYANGYYVLNSGYTVDGKEFTEASLQCEVLVREESGKLVFKVIVFEVNDKNARVERSITYTLNVPDGLSYSVTLATIGSILRPDTTTTTQAEIPATIGGYSL